MRHLIRASLIHPAVCKCCCVVSSVAFAPAVLPHHLRACHEEVRLNCLTHKLSVLVVGDRLTNLQLVSATGAVRSTLQPYRVLRGVMPLSPAQSGQPTGVVPTRRRQVFCWLRFSMRAEASRLSSAEKNSAVWVSGTSAQRAI